MTTFANKTLSVVALVSSGNLISNSALAHNASDQFHVHLLGSEVVTTVCVIIAIALSAYLCCRALKR